MKRILPLMLGRACENVNTRKLNHRFRPVNFAVSVTVAPRPMLQPGLAAGKGVVHNCHAT
jgi:hypothetical protein